MTQHNEHLSKAFLMVLVLAALYFCYLILKPFLVVIVAAAILVSIFYPLYSRLEKKIGHRERLAALIMVILIALLIIVPLTNFLIFLSQKSLDAYLSVRESIESGSLSQWQESLFSRYSWLNAEWLDIEEYLIAVSLKIRDVLVSGGASVVKSTTQMITATILVIFTMYFLFKDGPKLLKKIMYLTPLSNKYDRVIFQKFRDVSYSVVVATLVTAVVQGIVGAIGFLIIGIPAFFAGVAMAIMSLLPFVGTTVVWLPVAGYLLLTGRIWQGIFLIIWGAVAVGLIDNLLRPYLIKGKAHVHPLLILFSILGGVMIFGFWGVVFGPLIIAIALTLLHIYELEYGKVLEK